MHLYEDELKVILNKVTACEKYFGQFATANKIQIDKSKLPIIYVDFIGEDPISSFELELEFSLYIAHASFSSNKKTREKNQDEITDLLININKHLYNACVLDSQIIELKNSKKILDNKVDNSYITIFQKNLKFIIPKQNQGEEIE